jgi:hypothetical protein
MPGNPALSVRPQKENKDCARALLSPETYVFCGSRALLILPGHYPTGIARGIRPFVDLLLTRRVERKKPPGWAALKLLILLGKSGCGGAQPTILAIGRTPDPQTRRLM